MESILTIHKQIVINTIKNKKIDNKSSEFILEEYSKHNPDLELFIEYIDFFIQDNITALFCFHSYCKYKIRKRDYPNGFQDEYPF